MRVISIVSTVFLARLLDPADFGLVALALVLVSTSVLFSGMGMRQALIQTRLDKNTAAYHAFVITLFAGLGFALAVFIGADLLAVILGMKQTAPLLRAMSVIILFQSVSVVPDALLQKDLLFVRVSGSMILPELMYLGVAVAGALSGFGLWSLVYGGITRALSRAMLLLLISPELTWLRPRALNRSIILSLLSYGLQATASGFVSFFNSIADNLFVGRVLGALPLGYYSKAYDFSTNTADGFTKVFGGVLFPSYSLIQEDRERLSRAYIKSLGLVALVTVPTSTGILLVAPELILTLFGAKWIPMVTCLQILSFMCIVRAISSSASPVFLSTGHPEYDLRAGLLVTGVAIPAMFLLQPMGIEGVALAFLIAHILGLCYNIYQVHRLLPGTTSGIVAATRPAFFGSFAIVLVVSASRSLGNVLFGSGPSLVGLTSMVLMGFLAYVLSIYFINRALFYEIRALLGSVLKPRTTTR